MMRRLLALLLVASGWPGSAAASGYVHLTSIGSSGSGQGQLLFPYDVEVHAGLLYVADSHNNRVHVFTTEGEFVRMWGATGSADGQFRRDRGLTVDPRPASGPWVYVTDAKNDRVQRFSFDGVHDASFGSIGDAPDQFFRPRGIAVSSAGHVVVCDADNQRVKIHRPDLSVLRVLGGVGGTSASFRAPFDVEVSPDDRIYVVDSFNARIQVFDLEGTRLFEFGDYGPGDGQFVVPKAITIGGDGSVFVADTGDGTHDVDRIQRFGPDGTFVQSFGRPGGGPGELDFVTGLAIDEEGRLYAAESNNDRISVWGPPTVTRERRSVSSLKRGWR